MELPSRFVSDHNLIARYGAKYQGFAGSGVGGPDKAFYTRVHTLRLGSAEVHEPLALLFTDNQRGGATTTNIANVGFHVLRQFTITFDVPHGVMYLEPDALYGEADTFNRAGLVLEGDHDALVVRTVLPGSPGAIAGIRENDRILDVEGKSTAQPSDVAALSEPIGLDYFLQQKGTLIHLRIQRGSEVHDVTVRLAQLL